MKTTIIIQARMNSSRFPGKVMEKIENLPMIEIILKRLNKSRQKNDILVATSKDKKNEILINFLKKKRLNIF